MRRRDHERAADVDREEVAERLRQAVTEGRLDLDEYDDRLAQTYASKTYGQLDQLVGDLPRPAPAAPGGPTTTDRRHPYAVRAWLTDLWKPWTRVVAICVAIWLFTVVMSQAAVYFWPVWVAGPWGAVLLCRSIYGLSSGEPHEWAAERAANRTRPAPRPGC